jgi:hypothetical protein
MPWKATIQISDTETRTIACRTLRDAKNAAADWLNAWSLDGKRPFPAGLDRTETGYRYAAYREDASGFRRTATFERIAIEDVTADLALAGLLRPDSFYAPDFDIAAFHATAREEP